VVPIKKKGNVVAGCSHIQKKYVTSAAEGRTALVSWYEFLEKAGQN